MKKFLMLGAIVALVAAALAVPALAQRNGDGGLVNFEDCFPFCNDDSGSNQALQQQDDDSERARLAREDDFLGFLADRFDDDEEFFDFFGERFDNGNDRNEPVVNQQIGQEAQSGDLSIQGSVSQRGDYSMQCAAPLQFGNTGNLQNAQGFAQYASNAEDIEFGGSTFEFSPTLGVRCDQAVQQSAVASGR